VKNPRAGETARATNLRRPRVLILIPTFQPNDAVGNDVLGMYTTLKDEGYDATVLAQFVHPAHQSITTILNSGNSVPWDDRDAVMIYHHAIDWDLGESVLAKSRNKIVIKYHNVTPAHFYSNYAEHYRWACIKGIEATKRLAKVPVTQVWGDSWYNAREFVDLGVPEERCRVVAPMHRIDELERVPFGAVVAGTYRGRVHNILFVGGIRPNKGHAKALEVLVALKELTDAPVRLLFVGNYDPNLRSYMDELRSHVGQLDLTEGEDVVFATSVTPSQLRAYYMTASVFLCVSEHEGFCVPLVEAMAFRVPIVAWATTAVGETAGDCGYVVDAYDPEELAKGIAEIIENPATAREFASRGRSRYETVFSTGAIRRKFLSLLSEVS
jgi:glycosyltransferase involved in cell wall biosynthesis